MNLTPIELVAMARRLLRQASPAPAGLWPKAAALLGRQALETTLAARFGAVRPGLEACSVRIQLLCLGELGLEPGMASQVRHAWSGLSQACHHHPYDFAPGSAEVETWLAAVHGMSHPHQPPIQCVPATRGTERHDAR